MVIADLVTGFLGSGKTTFIKKYAQYLVSQGEHICILENDFGPINVDTMLLQDLLGDHCELEMIAGGCDYETHRRRFRTKLIAMAMSGYDRVIIEPSGIFDVDEFFDIIHDDPLENWYQIGSILTIVSAVLPDGLSRESDYLLAAQISQSGKIILSRSQEASPEQIKAVKLHLCRTLETFHSSRKLSDNDYLEKDWRNLTVRDMADLSNAGYVLADIVKLGIDRSNAYGSLYFLNVRMNARELKDIIRKIFDDSACGKVMRIKGFLKNDNSWTEFNAVPDHIITTPVLKGQEVIIVIGEDLSEERLKTYFPSVA